MSLLVLDLDNAGGKTDGKTGGGTGGEAGVDRLGTQIHAQLAELELHTLETSDPRVAVDLASKGSIELVVCCQASALSKLATLSPGVALVIASTKTFSAEQVIDLMRKNVHDIWYWPSVVDQLEERVAALKRRVATWLESLDAEMNGMRSELERDQRAGQYIQMGMLPPNPMAIGHYKLQHRVEPSLILSGDFVDYFQISDRYFAAYVADVSGHGASSAFVTVLLKNFSRRLRREYRVSMLSNPGEILEWINVELLDQGIDKHVAMFLAIFDMRDDVCHYANAAHLPPAALVVEDRHVSLEQKAKPLGLFAGLEFESLTVDFPPGAKLVVFSDGVLDLVPEETLSAKEKHLVDAICGTQTMDELWSTLRRDQIGPDDVSCLMVQYE